MSQRPLAGRGRARGRRRTLGSLLVTEVLTELGYAPIEAKRSPAASKNVWPAPSARLKSDGALVWVGSAWASAEGMGGFAPQVSGQGAVGALAAPCSRATGSPAAAHRRWSPAPDAD